MADDQHRAADFGQPQIHFPVGVLEDSKAGNFLSHVDDLVLAVALFDSKQDEKAFADLAGDFASHCH